MPRYFDIIVETGLRIPQGCAGKHIRKQGEHRQRIKGIWIGGAARGRATGEVAHRDRHRLGNKGILDFDVIRSRSPQACRIPRVFDFVVAFVKQKDAVFDTVGFVVGRNNAGKHIPFAGIRPRGERPSASQHISAFDFSGATSRKYEGGCNQSVGVLVPDQILGALVEHAQHPVVAREIGEVPGHRCIRLPERIGAIDQRDIIEFRASHPLRLHDPEQTRIMQIAFGLRRQTPQLLRPGSALAEYWDERFGTCNHGRIGAVVRIRPRGQICVWHPTNTCHFDVLAISPVVRF